MYGRFHQADISHHISDIEFILFTEYTNTIQELILEQAMEPIYLPVRQVQLFCLDGMEAMVTALSSTTAAALRLCTDI